MKFNAKKIIKFCGNILMLAACMFIGVKLYSYKEQIAWEQIFAQKEIVFVEIISYALVMLMSPITYQILVRITTRVRVPFKEVQYVCCKSNILKYVPGNIFQYIGRNQLAIEQNLKHSEVAMATIFEIATIISSSIIVTLVLARESAFIWMKKYGDFEWIVKIIIIIVCVAGIVVFLLRKKLTTIWKKLLHICSVENFIRLFEAGAWFSVMLIIDGILFGFLFKVVGIEFSFNELYRVIGLFALSYCIGYVMPGVPGGIGVRETVLLLFMGDIVDRAVLVTITVLFRIISIGGDVLAYFVVEILRIIRRRQINKI